MKPPILVPLVICALTSCQTAHDVAVSGFRVIDAPAVYVRRQLGVDEPPPPSTTTTTTTTVETNAPPQQGGYPPGQEPATGAPPAQQRVVTGESKPRPTPTATPRLARTSPTPGESRTTEARVTPAPRTAASEKSELPYAKPVPGKPGYVYSPFDKNGGYVDVTGYSPGQKVKDPYTGKIFLVP